MGGVDRSRENVAAEVFHDARGGELFEQITRLPEYYPSPVERPLFAAHAPQFAADGPAGTLIELGSGSSEKTPLLLDALGGSGSLRGYVVGITDEFTRNMLRMLNTELGADFDAHAVEHLAIWDEDEHWIETRSRATRPAQGRLPGTGFEISHTNGEELRTETSAKFHFSEITAELEAAGLSVAGQWTDPQSRFALTVAEPA